MFHYKVAHSNSAEGRQLVPEENPLLPDWLGGRRTVVTETPQTHPVPAAAMVPTVASVSLPQPTGELFHSYLGVKVLQNRDLRYLQ
jgi:hypothetical protein